MSEYDGHCVSHNTYFTKECGNCWRVRHFYIAVVNAKYVNRVIPVEAKILTLADLEDDEYKYGGQAYA